MVFRKINAGLSLIATVLLMGHAGFLSVWMLSRCRIAKPGGNMSWMLVLMMVLHMLCSMILMALGHKHTNRKKEKSYLHINFSTYGQRFTGVLIVLLLGLHLFGAANHFQPKLLHAILHPIFFACALSHVAVSFGRGLVTLGIGNTKVILIVDLLMKLLCGITWVAGVIGFYLCLFVGVAR